ncbi:lysine-specific demethylase 2A-like [Penaeus japonicus]|uniref:lysine-specific demethylase 2A-like n=1 Tax=Penaeus japonicus TaxID=27405 RepID=UPI001C7159F6|nr:lysine-specific demethylase 2A-like [Penaeus japonicus]
MASRSTGGGTILASGIRTRERKERKLYSDDWALGDEEIEGHHTFDLEQKIKTDKFDSCFVKDMTEHDYTLAHVQKNGFNWPLLFKDKSKLGITIPSSDFTINDVRLCVGSRRMLDVMDVNTQKNVEMTMKDWQRYFDSQDKDKLLNVISLEFSHTKLESLVQAPTVVRQVDWVERVWPRHLKEAQTEATNVLEDMMYPKVQKYCLMSVRGCYTDFHIDFGGTSVWYHVLRGRKIFWLIPPTERNLQLYEQWVLSGKQSDIFFGDTVEKCARIELRQGNTFFIPTGWIHAVYTPEDSLVFGGNFLHSFGIEKQLRVAQVEDATHVPQKFRYPFFTEMLWYVLERYVHVLLGRTHLTLPPDEQQKYERYLASKKKNNNNNKVKGEDEESDGGEDVPEEHIHLTQYELHGLKAIVMYLHALPTSKKCVPELITDPIALIRDVRTVVEKHRYDTPELSTTSRPVLEWWPRESTKFGVKRPLTDPAGAMTKRRRRNSDENKVVRLPPNAAKIRHRRVRCKLCESCLRDDCRQCGFCMDMVKYGGPGTMKQTCKMKKCTQPMLPVTAVCYECQLDGWGRVITTPPQKPPQNVPSGLFECCICYKISHLKCLSSKYDDVDGIVNEDLPNSWECPECVKEGYNKEYKHNRVPSSRTSTAGSDTGDIKTPQVLSEAEEDVKVKLETLENGGGKSFDPKKDMSPVKVKQEIGSAVEALDAAPPHMPTWEQLQARVSRPLVRPMWVVRPTPPLPDEEEEEEEEDEESGSDGESRTAAREPPPPTMNRSVMLPIFHHLSVQDLKVVMQVCRAWAQWAIHPALWKAIRLSHKRIHATHLEGVVRRQPRSLDLSWAKISAEQFSWLLARLPQLRELHLEGQNWQVISCLTSPYCPALSVLNLSYCEGLTDNSLTVLLSAPRSHRPGHRDTSTRLRQLTDFRLAGTQVGDEGVRAVVRSLPFLTTLDLSSCQRITELTAALLAQPSSVVSHSLSSLDLRGCHRLAPTCLPSLKCLPLLEKLALHPCSRIPLPALRVWGKSHGYALTSQDILVRKPPPPPDPTADPSSDSDLSSLSRSSSPGPTPAGQNGEQVTPEDEKRKGPEESQGSGGKVTDQKNNNTETPLPEKIKVETEKELGGSDKASTEIKAESTCEKKPDIASTKENVKEKTDCTSSLEKKPDEPGPIKSEPATPKSGPDSSPSSGLRVSTRRQSRLQEGEGESGNKSNAEHAVKKNSSPDVKEKKSSSNADQALKKCAGSADQTKGSNNSEDKSVNEDSDQKVKKPSEQASEKATAPEQPVKNPTSLSRENKERNRSPTCEKKGKSSDSHHAQQWKEKSGELATKKGSSSDVNTKKQNATSNQAGDKKSGNTNSSEKENEKKPVSEPSPSKGHCSSSAEQNRKKNVSNTTEETSQKQGNTSEDASKTASCPEQESKLSKASTSPENTEKNLGDSAEAVKKAGPSSVENKKSNPSGTEEVDKKIASTSGSASSSEEKDKKSGVPQGGENKKSGSPAASIAKKKVPASPDQSSKRKCVEKKGSTSPATSSASKSSDQQKNQKNIIITSVEVHRADTYEGRGEAESGAKRPERRQSVRRSKDEQEGKPEEKREKNEKGGTESPKDKRRDSKSREEEMNKITVEDSSEKEMKSPAARKIDEKRLSSAGKRSGDKHLGQEGTAKVKQEKDIVTRSTKRLKCEKGTEETQSDRPKEEEQTKASESVVDTRKTSRRSRESREEKEEAPVEEVEKREIKSPRPIGGRREKENLSGKTTEKKDDDPKVTKRVKTESEEYMSKLRRKSHDGEASSDSSSVPENARKEDATHEKIRSRRRSLRDDDASKSSTEKKREDAKEEKAKTLQNPAPEQAESPAKASKNSSQSSEGSDSGSKHKRKNDDSDEAPPSSSGKKSKDEAEESSRVSKKSSELHRERSGSRERPERAHRSPRRLSMCQ